MKVAIIGAGPAGLTCAIKRAVGNKVVVFERNKEAGKKLLLTGSGRCNIGNQKHENSNYYSHSLFKVEKIITKSNLKKLDEFLTECGIVLKNKNGYLYPYSESSKSVVSCLVNKAKSLGVEFRFETLVDKIDKKKDKFVIGKESFDKVIIACGGLSYPKTGSDGIGFELAKSLRHRVFPLTPSLVPLYSNIGIEKLWKGVRVDAIVSLYEDGYFFKKERGELQLTDYGLSGICIFNLSRDVSLDVDASFDVYINFVPFMNEEDVLDTLEKRSLLYKDISVSNLCDGFLDYKLTNAILNYLHLDNKVWNKLSREEKELFASSLSNFKVHIEGAKGFDVAQVTCGGVYLDELNLNDLSSVYDENLHFAGEILDLDGDCGGYNLTIAFITGLLAGGINDKN